MGLQTRLRSIASRAGTALLVYASDPPAPLEARTVVSSPTAPGFARFAPTYPGLSNPELSRSAQLLEALFGRISLATGPALTRYSTVSGQLSPESISSAIQLANQGQPFAFADLSKMVIEKTRTSAA